MSTPSPALARALSRGRRLIPLALIALATTTLSACVVAPVAPHPAVRYEADVYWGYPYAYPYGYPRGYYRYREAPRGHGWDRGRPPPRRDYRRQEGPDLPGLPRPPHLPRLEDLPRPGHGLPRPPGLP